MLAVCADWRSTLNLDLARQDIEMPRCDILWSFLGMQNACGTPEKLQRLLCRAWDSLSDGGVFLGAIPNGTKIM